MGTLARRGAAYVGLWALLVCAIAWATALPDALDLLGRTGPVEPDELTSSRLSAQAVVVLGVACPVLFLLLQPVWMPRPALRRTFLVLAAACLAASAWVWPQLPDTGEWWPWVSLAGAAAALVGATVSEWPPAGQGDGVVAGLVLSLAGAAVAVLAWRGLDYQQWDWYPTTTGPMWLALVVGLALVLVGLAGRFLPGGRASAVLATLVLGVLTCVVLLVPVMWLLEMDQLQRHEETEAAWTAMPVVVGGVGLLGAAVATRRGWWDLAALTLGVALLVGAGGIYGSDLGDLL